MGVRRWAITEWDALGARLRPSLTSPTDSTTNRDFPPPFTNPSRVAAANASHMDPIQAAAPPVAAKHRSFYA
jgi:hypothetical protein